MAIKMLKEATKVFLAECGKCDCVFQYDISDVYTGFSYSYVHCPHCNTTIPHENRKNHKENEIKNAPTVNLYEWISVEDRLPDELFTAVLIYCPKNQNIYCAYLNTRNEWHIFDYGVGQQVVESVTHWMPLPNSPATKQ